MNSRPPAVARNPDLSERMLRRAGFAGTYAAFVAADVRDAIMRRDATIPFVIARFCQTGNTMRAGEAAVHNYARFGSAVALSALIVACALGSVTAHAADPKIAAGANSTCAVSQVGVLRCMGLNDHGQLGVSANAGTDTPLSAPQEVQLGGAVADVAIGLDHMCAVLTDGAVKCVGNNTSGQLGSTVNNGVMSVNNSPQTVPLTGPAGAIIAGQFFTCALLRDGAVQCWGTNQYGQLGVAYHSGTIDPTPSPQTLSLTGPATLIAGGKFQHSCAVIQGGSVQCWGSNFYGNLASAINAGTSFNPLLPVGGGVGGVTTGAAAGNSHTCVTKQDGAVECFGNNYRGQLGGSTNLNTGNANSAPSAATLGAAATQVAAGQGSTCALLSGGSVSCFGDNEYGQLGNSTDVGASVAHPVPTAVTGLAGPVLKIAAGYNHACAIIQSGPVQCWGMNGTGQLGQDPSTLVFSSPTTVAGLSLFDAPPPKTDLSVKRPKLKTKRSGRKLLLTSTIVVTGSGGAALDAGSCNGQVAMKITAKIRNKRTGRSHNRTFARKSLRMKRRAQRCELRIKHRIGRSAAGKRVALALDFPGSTEFNLFGVTFKLKIPPPRR